MKCGRQIRCLGLLLAIGSGVGGLAPRAAASAFTITATDVIMPASGAGTTQWTVTGIPLTGTLLVSCQYVGVATTAKIPYCLSGPGPVQVPISVTAGQTVTGKMYFYMYPVPVGAHRTGYAPWAGPALAGALLLGVGLRRRARNWLALWVLAAGTFAGLAGIVSCGGNPASRTFTYTLTADNEASPVTPLGQGVSTTITVTVP